MELRHGYKQTEVGVIPQDWEVTRLAEVVEFLDGKRRPVKDSDRAKMRGSFPYYGASGIVDFVNDYLFDEDLILLGEDGENILSRNLPLAFRVSGKIWVNNHAHVLRPLARADIGYLTEYLESVDYANFNSGTAQPKLNKQSCIRLPVVLPPLSEQRCIAVVFSDADELIASLDALIAKKRDIKQAAMQRLLTGEVRLPNFNTKWHSTTLGAISAFITKGATPTTYGFEWKTDGVCFLRSECVSDSGLDLTQSMFISPEAHEALKRGEVRSGDLLVTITGNVGRVVLLDQEFGVANINQHIARVRVKSADIDSRYVYHYLSQSKIRKYYNSIITGQAYPQISLKQVRETTIPLPEYAEQVSIANVLSDIDAEISVLEANRDKARTLKQGMMQELLTGRIRLK